MAVDVSLPHLDRPFDYSVPDAMADEVRVGCRVRVRFAGRQVGGFVLALDDSSDHPGGLQPLRRVTSGEPVLSPEVARLARTVADRYAGTLADVLRLAVPPRHARVEREPRPAPAILPEVRASPTGLAAWERAEGGTELLDQLAAGVTPRAAWTALPGDDWPAALAIAAKSCARAGRGAVLCLPDRRDVARVDAALTDVLGSGRHVVLAADLGPSARYRAFLSVLRGDVSVVVGTRAAAFAPVRDPGLLVVWDDGDDLHAEPRAPYPHVREVLALRAHQERAGLLVAGHARTPETQQLVESGWLTSVQAVRDVVRSAWPRVVVAAGDGGAARSARLPPEASALVRARLDRGPVLLQMPRTGYRARLACQDCRTPADCTECGGPLGQPGPSRPPTCRWCGRVEVGWHCTECGGERLRAPVVGERRTAEEIGRAFPGVSIRRSTGDQIIEHVSSSPAVVVATPGAEPTAEGGYAAGVLLDVGLTLARPDLRAAEDALRRWLAVAALVRPAADGGQLMVVGDPARPVVQALIRADPAGFAERELVQRRATRMPPSTRLATVEGPAPALAELADPRRDPNETEWPDPVELLGPVDIGADRARLVVRVPWAAGPQLAHTLALLQSGRSAHKQPPLRVVVDPAALG